VRLNNVLMGIANGIGLAGLGLLVWRRAHSQHDFPSQPGHWLLVLGGTAVLIDGFATLAVRAYATQQDVPFPPFYFPHQQAAAYGMGTVVVALTTVRAKLDLPWRLFLGLVLFLTSVLTLWNLAFLWASPGWQRYHWYGFPWYFFGVIVTLIGTILLLLVAREFRVARNRDWLHWCGIGMAIAFCVIHLLPYIRYHGS
jgi:hypothetical protein